MAVYTIDPFDAQMPFPLDLRNRKADVNGRNAIPSNARYRGMLVWTDNERVVWVLDAGPSGDPADNNNWKQLYPATGGDVQNVTWSANAPTTEGSNGDIWFRNNAGTGNIELYFKQGGSWGMLGSWSKEGTRPTYTSDPSTPNTSALSYLNTTYPNAKPGDQVYKVTSGMRRTWTCYAAGAWSRIDEVIET